MPLPALSASADSRVAGDRARLQPSSAHPFQELQGLVPELALLACSERGAIGNDVRQGALMLHL
eukprot:CAMPEP_0117613980 /NCGR_PEP_ID=MMETSP0784-20121206/83775_1 /TAXON_ID=39447 /ORGANISM="" /LENGTH=63 /DNA_ID=CAMNT_0005417645 /DNA_START=41 /DNA_END=229 /DNA_ORIENTATION=+